MLKVIRYINELMTSNCYLLVDEASGHCVCIDPASEKSEREISYIESKGLTLDYIILTHEHTDHNWGVNALREHFPSCKLICSEPCNKYLKKTNRAYFLFYYDDPDYCYEIAPADILISNQEDAISWNGLDIKFILTPGHSYGSMCIDIDNVIFGGDTLIQSKPFIRKRNGGSLKQFNESVKRILSNYPEQTLVYPGHGEPFMLDCYNII